MKREHHYLLWGIVLLIAILAWLHYKKQMQAIATNQSNMSGGIVLPGVPG